MGWFQRLSEGLNKTRKKISGELTVLFEIGPQVGDEFWDDLEATLLMADIGVGATDQVVTRLRERSQRESLTGVREVKEALVELLAEAFTQAESDPIAANPSCVLFVGVNGAGKTTTIRMLSCLSRPTSGEALLGGKSIVRDTAAVKAMIGVSPQETAVAPNLTVKENLELMCGVHGFSKEKSRQKVTALSVQFGLDAVLKKKASRLSGGWQRRLSIAMALISEPQILFLDEPTLGLDVLARSDLWDAIRALKGAITIILTTHYMEEAEALSDRIGIMKDGRLLTTGTAEELKQLAGKDKFEDAFVAIVKEDAT